MLHFPRSMQSPFGLELDDFTSMKSDTMLVMTSAPGMEFTVLVLVDPRTVGQSNIDTLAEFQDFDRSVELPFAALTAGASDCPALQINAQLGP